ncbi:MAG: alpha/beta hydrolase [Myxococcales bacterium]|nr:alpha/beta hydrolase [Myxococcales bacterium]
MSLPTFDRQIIQSFDGTELEIQTWGDGPLTLVIANGLGGTLVAWTPLLRALKGTARIVSWDYRGLYGSKRPPNLADLGVEHHVGDMRAVMDATGVETAIIAGWSMGVQVCIQAAADLDDRVTGVVLINGTYGRVFETAFSVPGSRHILPWINHAAIALAPALPPAIGLLTKQNWFLPAIERIGLVDKRLDKEVFLAIAKGFDQLDFDVYHRIMGQLNDHDGEPALSRIDVPLLMIAGDRDAMTPPSVRHVVHQRVPHAESHVIPGGTHYTLLEYPDAVISRVQRFFDEHFDAA